MGRAPGMRRDVPTIEGILAPVFVLKLMTTCGTDFQKSDALHWAAE